MEYEVSLQTIGWFKERRDSENLEISPKFQRRAVWLEKERSELLETILTKLPFPEIYVQVLTNQDTGSQKYIVVDGQQRVTSILKFIDGEVSLPLGSEWDGLSFRELSPDDKQTFWDYKIVVRMLRRTNDAEIRDLFQRLNTNNVVLNDQELRNAKYTGKFKQASERLADDSFFQSIGLFSAREVRRMEDVEFVSELLLYLVAGVQNKKTNLEDYYAAFNEDFPDESKYELEFRTALNLIQQIINDENKSLIKTKSNFYSLFGACFKYNRFYDRTAFRKADLIGEKITELLASARGYKGMEEEADPIVSEYYDAVSRAASDKQRRAKREEILFSLVKSTEES